MWIGFIAIWISHTELPCYLLFKVGVSFVLFCLVSNIMISGTAGRIGAHKVSVEASFSVELWKTIGSRNGSTDPGILNFKVLLAS